ncbi:MAG TPA: BON domain-containing protein [Pyrinomonadaceae bacterium]|nr:BON domain-containing protein [Pyrinomonadaceae bacterium]
MSNRITGLIATIALSLLVAACEGGTANRNANNANANANTGALASPSPTAVANTNTNTGRAPTREEYERDRERYEREARESGRTIGTGANDGWLWVKTRFELATADDLRDSTINVDVDNAVVTLTGTVASAAQKTRAEQVAKAVEDVRSVRNQLRVVSDNANGNANSNTRRGNANR